MFKVEWKGTGNLRRQYDQLINRLPDVEWRALYMTAEQIMTLSKAEYVPVDTGFLRGSGYVRMPVRVGSNYVVELGFNAHYALYVHEDLQAYHRVGQAKYLEAPVLLAQQRQWLEHNLVKEMKQKGLI